MSVISSFDVFDTMLTRRVGSPDAVYDVLGRALTEGGLIPCSARAFAAARRRQEQRLTRILSRHPTLLEIHHEVARLLSAGDASADAWAHEEEELDRRLTVPVPGADRLLDAARASGRQVVFVSDTPHSERFLADLLVEHGLARPGERVFTSSERGASKALGGLFTAVAGELGDGHRYQHVGDNPRSDLAAARVEGWSGRLVTAARLTKYEALLEEYAAETDSFTSWLAGSSRLARLEARDRGLPSALGDVAAGSLAPFLVGYALWVLAEARARGIRRLYYVARDGEVMLSVARQVIGRLAPDIELRYLYGSRQPWTFGACAFSDDVLRRWVQAKSDFTARTALARVRLSPEEVHSLSGLAFAHPDRADTPLSARERSELAAELQREPLVSLVRGHARESAERTMDYLRQEGLADGVPAALVDAGWGGRTAGAFDWLQEAAGGAKVTHLVVGITGSTADISAHEGVEMVPWLFDEQSHPESVAGLPGPNVLVEMFCAGSVGRTVDYRRDGDRIVPVLEAETNDPVIEWGLPHLHEVAVRVADLVGPHLPQEPGSVDCASFVWDVLRAFWTTPSPSEVDAWGEFPWEEELADPYQAVAQRITTRAVVERMLRGEGSVRRNNTWRAGSALRSSQPWSGLLMFRAWQVENRRRIQRVPRRARLEIAKRRRS